MHSGEDRLAALTSDKQERRVALRIHHGIDGRTACGAFGAVHGCAWFTNHRDPNGRAVVEPLVGLPAHSTNGEAVMLDEIGAPGFGGLATEFVFDPPVVPKKVGTRMVGRWMFEVQLADGV